MRRQPTAGDPPKVARIVYQRHVISVYRGAFGIPWESSPCEIIALKESDLTVHLDDGQTVRTTGQGMHLIQPAGLEHPTQVSYFDPWAGKSVVRDLAENCVFESKNKTVGKTTTHEP